MAPRAAGWRLQDSEMIKKTKSPLRVTLAQCTHTDDTAQNSRMQRHLTPVERAMDAPRNLHRPH